MCKQGNLMRASPSRTAQVIPNPRALLLCEEKLSADEQNLAALLDFFGIPWKAVTHLQMMRECAVAENVGTGRFCVLSSAACLAASLQRVGVADATLPAWLLSASSVYVYGFQETSKCIGLLQSLTGINEVKIQKPRASESLLCVASDFPEMCGPMSG